MNKKIICFVLCISILSFNINFSYASDDEYMFFDGVRYKVVDSLEQVLLPSSSSAFFPSIALAPELIVSLLTISAYFGIKFTDYQDYDKYLFSLSQQKDFSSAIKDLEAAILLSVNGAIQIPSAIANVIKEYSKSNDLKSNSVIGVTNVDSLDYLVSPYDEGTQYNSFYNWNKKNELNSLKVKLDFEQTVRYNDFLKINLSYDSRQYGNLSFINDVDMTVYSITLNSSGISSYTDLVSVGIILYTSNSFVKTSVKYSYYKKNDVPFVSGAVPGNDFALPFSDIYMGKYSHVGNIDFNVPGDVSVYVPQDVSSLLNPNIDVTSPDNYHVYVPGSDLVIPGLDTIVKPGDSIFDNVNPPVDPPTVDPPIFPPFPNLGDGINMDYLKIDTITEKFPFSLPWDIKNFIDMFDVEPKAPVFDVPIVSEQIEIDFTMFNELANIIRFFVLILFSCTLIFISTKLMG